MRFPAAPLPFDLATVDFDDLRRVAPHVAPVLADGRYLHWDQLRRRPPPRGLTLQQWWSAHKIARLSARVRIPEFTDERYESFWFCRLDAIERATHRLDRRDHVRPMLEALGDTRMREQHRIDQLIEEAINSSLIEGARISTRAQAKAMIRGGLQPTSQGERMVLNNYRGMTRLLELAGSKLSIDDLLEIHFILGADALETPGAEGRLRTKDDDVRVEDATSGEVWFIPPPASRLRKELARMLAFANAQDSEPFVHPLVRAIVLHFWLAYLHPFVDGNGRMARALFYWQMLHAGYEFAQFLSISGPIDRAPRAYDLAFAYTETDGGDLTYFILHQLKVLDKATDELVNQLREHGQRLKHLSEALSASETLNHRQRAVLATLVREPHQEVTVAGHKASHAISYLTARKDLQDLEQQGLLRRVRAGKTDRYFATDSLLDRFDAPPPMAPIPRSIAPRRRTR